MSAAARVARRRPNMRKAVFLFPSGLTLLNLFFGVFAIIAAARLEFTTAGVYVVIGGICDALDGRVARATNAGSQFGEELDSLVDAITFGLAPGMIMYFAVLNRGGWDWVWVFAFAAAAVLRLARFNIEQAGTAKVYFQGLPSPAAGITLASYYWFSQSWLYRYGMIANLKWHVALRILIAVLAALMISNVPYPSFPRTGLRSLRAIGSTLVVFGAFALLLTAKLEYFFPLAVLYVAFGLVRWMLAGLFERRQPTVPYDLSEGEDEEDDEYEVVEAVPVSSGRSQRATERSARLERSRASAPRTEPRARESVAAPDLEAAAPARAPRGERPDRTDRADRPERGERPQRTEAERAARREKREKRDKREGRGERAPRADLAGAAPADDAPLAVSTPPSSTNGPVREPSAEEPLVGLIPGGADVAATGTPEVNAEAGAPTRKRKRRRRRGARDRGEAGASGSDDGGEDDSGGDGDDSTSRSPYATPSAPPVPEHPDARAVVPAAAAPAPARPFTPPLPAPTPAPALAPRSTPDQGSEA